MRAFLSSFLWLCLLPIHVSADDGEQLYTLYCSACHAPDGKGAGDGAFPPLAGSAWIEGNPKRSIAIVLHGLHGPIEVSGKSYNLEMPPQGAVLSDNQILAILNYVHSAWGNNGQQIPRDLMRVARAEFESRKQPWTAPELLKLFPLPKRKTAITNLISRTYKGQWSQVPHFDKIQAENIEEEHNGILNPSIAGMNENFGIVWEGEFNAPEKAQYEFALDADDGARINLNGQTICEVKDRGPMNGKRACSGKVSLEQGINAIRVDYYQGVGGKGISLKWRKVGDKNWNWLSDQPKNQQKGYPSIPLAPTENQTVIYRNFIAGTTPRGIGFGFPGGLNLVYSADNLAPELVWAGDFMDAGRHWTNRGQGNQPPSGAKVIKLTTTRFLPTNARFKGYSLDPQGNPTFIIQIGNQLLSDSWKPSSNTLVRTLTLKGGSNLELPLGNSEATEAKSATLTPGKPTTINYLLK